MKKYLPLLLTVVAGVVLILLSNRLDLFITKSGGGKAYEEFRQAARVQHSRASMIFIGRTFPVGKYRDLINEIPQVSTFKGLTIIIVLSDVGCSPCQVRELRNLDTLSRNLKGDIQMIAILNSENRREALSLKRVGMVRFPMWYGADSVLTSFNLSRKYPLILLLTDQTIDSAFLPVGMDDDFSKTYMQNLYSMVQMRHRSTLPSKPR